jgi:hypothetical protein
MFTKLKQHFRIKTEVGRGYNANDFVSSAGSMWPQSSAQWVSAIDNGWGWVKNKHCAGWPTISNQYVQLFSRCSTWTVAVSQWVMQQLVTEAGVSRTTAMHILEDILKIHRITSSGLSLLLRNGNVAPLRICQHPPGMTPHKRMHSCTASVMDATWHGCAMQSHTTSHRPVQPLTKQTHVPGALSASNAPPYFHSPPIVLHDKTRVHMAARIKDFLKCWQWETAEPPYSLHTVTLIIIYPCRLRRHRNLSNGCGFAGETSTKQWGDLLRTLRQTSLLI